MGCLNNNIMSDTFCLKWNDYHSNVSKSFGRLRNKDEFHDVTLVSDDRKQVFAHKVILSSCSEYFRNVLKQNIHPNPLLCLEGITFKDMNNVMDYIYCGEVNMYQDDLDRFLKIAERLKLEGLIGVGGDDNLKSFENEYDAEPISHDSKEIKPVNFIENFEEFGTTAIPNDNSKIIVNSDDFADIEKLDAKINEHIVKTEDGKYMCNICEKIMKYRHHVKEHVEIHFDGLSS